MDLHVNFHSCDGLELYVCEDSESAFYRLIGERLMGLSVPNTITITVDEYPGKTERALRAVPQG